MRQMEANMMGKKEEEDIGQGRVSNGFFGRQKASSRTTFDNEGEGQEMKKKIMIMADRRRVGEEEKEGEKMLAPAQKPRTTNSVASSITFSNEQIWQRRQPSADEAKLESGELVNTSSNISRPLELMKKWPSISSVEPKGAQGGRYTLKFEDTEYIVDVNNQGDPRQNFRLYRRSNSVAGKAPTLAAAQHHPKMSVVGRMASIFLGDGSSGSPPSADSNSGLSGGGRTRPFMLGMLGRQGSRSACWGGSVPFRQRSGEEEATSEKSANDEERQKRLGQMAEEAAKKLRYILHQLNSGQLPLEDLKRNIEYAALVLETAYMDETRRICDEDDDLAEVTPEAVPDEVREWLAATFTRKTVQVKREKPKFKSVANAIRTGIFFEKIYRRTQAIVAPIPPEYQPFLRLVNNWNFNSFELDEVTNGHALKYIGFELFNRYGFLERFKINTQVLENFLLVLEVGYSKHNNPYHNCVHSADVTQTSHWILSQTGLASTLTDLEILAVLFGALIHDFEHTGHTNNFHIQSGSNFALLYNDRSVLENHHASSVFRLMKDDDKNIFDRLTRDEFRDIRNMIIEIVLATDMSTHFVQIKTMKNMLTLPEGIDKMKALCLIVHACDISHASKPWDLHQRWTEGVLEEFFRQGDLEHSMGLPYSPLCDRHTTHVAESQIGFIDFIVEPTMVVCGEMLTKMVEPLVSLPSSDSLFLPGGGAGNHGGDGDGSASATSLSPLPPDLKSPSPGNSSSVRKIPINYFGKLEISTPWVRHLQENKANWRERAANEEAERNKTQQQMANRNGKTAAVNGGNGTEQQH